MNKTKRNEDTTHKRTAKSILVIFFSVVFMAEAFLHSAVLTVKAENAAAVSGESDIEAKINGFIAEHQDITPAVAINVFDKERDICSVIYGESDRENNIAANADTVFEWGSVSKLLIWTSAMQLYERGLLDFDKDIREYLPDGFLKNQKYEEPITMLHLMNHDAGFMEPYKELETKDRDKIMPLKRALEEIAPAQGFRPGEVVAYSNYGAALAAYVVECISGMDYANYVKANIFDRLGMEHTAIRPDLSDNVWVAEMRQKTHCYARENNALAPMGECRAYIHVYPSGSACGTVADMAAFAKAFLCDGKECPLFEKEETLYEMLSPSKYYADGETPRFCHGLMAEQYGTKLLGHGGNTTGFSSLLEIDRESGTGFVMMINLRGDSTYKGNLPQLLYGGLDPALYRENINTTYDFAGDYILSGGMFRTGCYKIYSLLNDRLRISREGDSYRGTNGIVKLTQISDTKVYVQLITGAEYIYYIKTDGNGKLLGMENKSVDFVKADDFSYPLLYGIIAVAVLGYALMAVLTVVHLIRYGKFKNTDLRAYKKAELAMGLSCTAVAIPVTALALLGIQIKGVTAALCISITLLSVMFVVLNGICILKRNRKWDGILVTESICNLCILIGVLYLNLFQYWGF